MTDLFSRKSALDTINQAIRRIRRPGHESSTATAPLRDTPPRKVVYLQSDGSKDLSAVAFAPPDPFIEHDEKQRQERIVAQCEKKFLKQDDAPSTENYCGSCSRINFEALNDDPENVLGDSIGFSVREIGTINDGWHNRTCRLCNLLTDIWQRNKSYFRGANLCLVLLSARNVSRYTGPVPISIRHRNILLLSHPQPRRVFEVDHTILNALDIVGPLFVSSLKLESDNCISVRPIDSTRIDYSLLRGWLGQCHQHHADICGNSRKETMSRLQVLDCRTRRVGPHIPGIEFVALSYVWGHTMEQRLRQPEFPRTVEDAIKVTLELGFRYLWIDRYCIPQTDELVSKMHTANMDIIYSCATLTIVAACGKDASHGLPGVSRRSRVVQPPITVDGCVIRSAPPNPVRDIASSAWMTRAWTYHDAVLSKRRLFFTETQVYFECCRASCVETISEPDESLFPQAHPGSGNLAEYQGLGGTALNLRHRLYDAHCITRLSTEPWLIQHHITEYTRRSLTVDSHILDAFLGVLKSFRNPLSFVSHIWGVPILWSPFAKWSIVEGFATGLCWTGLFPAHRAIERRVEYPTWSWAGWKIPISPKEDVYKHGFKIPYELKIDLETERGEMLTWDAYQAACRSGEPPMLSHHLHVEGWSLKCRIFLNDDGTEGVDASKQGFWSLIITGSTTKLDRVIIHKYYSNDEWQLLKDKEWDILIIGNSEHPAAARTEYFEHRPPFGPFLMILEDTGGWYERVGYVDLAHGLKESQEGQDMSSFIAGKKRRSFRLG